VSRLRVRPTFVEVIDDVLVEFAKREVGLRIVPSLWPLRDAIVASSLEFSVIRMRNALPREATQREIAPAAEPRTR
jgi:hypothetical protein